MCIGRMYTGVFGVRCTSVLRCDLYKCFDKWDAHVYLDRIYAGFLISEVHVCFEIGFIKKNLRNEVHKCFDKWGTQTKHYKVSI